jgi:hypothetical protein
LASLDPDEQVLLAFTAAQNPAEIMTLVARTPDDLLDALEPHAGELLAAAEGDEAEGDEAEGLQRKLDDLRSWRTTEAEARARLADVDEDALAQRLIAWIQQPDWDASQQFLAQNPALLDAAAAAALTLLWMANAGNDDVQLHHNLLAACRAQGIDAAYAQLYKENRFAQRFSTPLGQAVLGFVAAESDAAARQMLHDEPLLLTADAQLLLTALIEDKLIDGDAQPQVQQRLALWDEAWRARAGAPRRPAADDALRQPDPVSIDRLERQPLPPERTDDRAPRYHVVTAINSAIGPGASVLNIYDVGALPLQWRRPQQTRPDLARSAVGRRAELDELHRRLRDAQGGGLALVGVRGIAGIGKTWLAAMYASEYAGDYPGGVIWLDVGPRVRRQEEVAPLLQKLAAHAYAGDVRVAWLDEIVFAADVVQQLLSGHGRLLLIFDDVWSDAVAAALRAAAPPESAVLLTTRDRRVAYALGHGPDVIQELDVLTPADARALLQRRAPGVSDAVADAVARGVGYHALALDLAGAALFERGAARHQRTADELLRRVAEGRGFGDLPLEDRADAESNVEIILRYTYDYLGEDAAHGAGRQAALRALGAFAQEASFDTAAVAALWECLAEAAEARLLLFDQLALVQQTGDGRWRQHAILRAYAHSLQTSAERLALPLRHADYYLGMVRDNFITDTGRVAREFDQIEHSFAWCRVHSPARAARLAARVCQVMMIRGRAQQAGEWLRAGQEAARASGDRGNQANVLQSLGDLERRLGNIAAARGHYDAALPLYDAEQDRLGKANVLQSLGDLERRLGNIAAARGHYDAALPLYDAEQDRLGKANVLQSLGDLERRLGNIAAARGHYDAALPLYDAEQEPGGIINTLVMEARLELAANRPERAEELYTRAITYADRTVFHDHPFVQDARGELAALRQAQAASTDPTVQAHLQQLADLLVTWVQLTDLDAQAHFLDEHAADLLTDAAAHALQLLVQANDNHPALVQAQALLARCRTAGSAAAYADLRAARDNPLLAALAALLAVEDDAALRQALAGHPVLAQPQAALALGALLGQALEAEDAVSVSRLVVLFGVLLEQINQSAENDADVAVQTALVDLCDQVIALAADFDADLAAGLRTQAAWACNMLGNAHAQRRDPAAAVAAYTRGLGFDPAIAMLLRNRAGEQIELNALDAARADIEQAAHLEPDAPRLPLLWCDYYAALGDGAAMPPHLAALVAQSDRAAEAHYHRAVMHTLLGDHAAARAEMVAGAAIADDDLRRDGVASLQRLARRHAHMAAQWEGLAVVLMGGIAVD